MGQLCPSASTRAEVSLRTCCAGDVASAGPLQRSMSAGLRCIATGRGTVRQLALPPSETGAG